MRLRFTKYTLAFAASLMSACAFAQQGDFNFGHLDINQGLSNNQVNCFLKDSTGFLWVGTMSGLNRYDGYTVKVFQHDARDTTSIRDNYVGRISEGPEGKLWVRQSVNFSIYDPATEIFHPKASVFLNKYAIADSITDMFKDTGGNFWFFHSLHGVYRLEKNAAKAVRIEPADNQGKRNGTAVTSMTSGLQNSLWMIHQDGVLEEIDPTSGKVHYRNDFLPAKYGNERLTYSMIADADGDLWFFSNKDRGVGFFNTRLKTWTLIDKSSQGFHLNTDIVRGIVQDNAGYIWIATDHGGINVINKKEKTIRYLLQQEGDNRSLSQNSITALYKDADGIIWAGTYKKGLNYYHENSIRFKVYQHRLADPASLQYDDVNRFVEDAKGNLWIGTNGGGLIYFDRTNNSFRRFSHDQTNPNTIANDVIVSLLIDHNNNLWIGTYYGGLDRFDGQKFIHYRNNAADPGSIADNSIWEIFEDARQNLWVGTLGGGLNLYDPRTNSFSHYRAGQTNSIYADYISAITEDVEGNLIIGTGSGFDVLRKADNRFEHHGNDITRRESLSNDGVLCIIQDSRGMVWIGTNDGLNLWNRKEDSFRTFRKEDGLPHNTILTLLEDDHGNVWASTPDGISNMIVPAKADFDFTPAFKNYDEYDGLQGKQFNENAALKTRKGELIFGGPNGFNIFKPENIRENRKIPPVVLSDLQILNKSVKPGQKIDGKVILPKAIEYTNHITLAHNQNAFSIEFAGLNFFHPEKSEYKYILENFNKKWLVADSKSRKVTYTNLDPGEYVFKVLASNNDRVWNETGTELKITILPPFWKTKIAILLYIVMIALGLLLLRFLILQRAKLKFRIEQERQESYRMHELDMMKIKFFTNISHEFRTPLSLILTPLDKLLKNSREPEQKNHFLLIHRNARRLLNLVNQLLDFRKMEVQEVRLNPSAGDIVAFVEEAVYSFSDLSEKKDIKLLFETTVRNFVTFFDQDKLERILFNLLSNAFKFTPSHGEVNVSLTLAAADSAEGNGHLIIKVTDTGIGIPAEKHQRIFERFFQHEMPRSMVNQGSGIGLSITKEFVRIHKGTIEVASEPEKGSCFTVTLPVQKIESAPAGFPSPALRSIREDEGELVIASETNSSGKPTLLLVEDNEDFRFYLKDNLRHDYRIVEARDGKEGWQLALSQIPDLIVSDVMMPEMNGIELCKKIKTDARLSHIPVILLTARSSEEQKIEGFETGANDYISKPFNFEILQSRIRNLIAQQELIRKSFQKHIAVKASNIEIASLDERLIMNAIKHVEDNISNADFSVEDLSSHLAMSRVYLYKKLLSLTGKTPLEFIRTIRLQRAAQLLKKSQLTVAEVAYKVGFNNPKYFARYFKSHFNILPSLYAEKGGQEG